MTEARRPAAVRTVSVPAAQSPTADPQVAEADAPDHSASGRLRAEFERAIRRLDDEMPHDQRTPDLMTLIGHLAGDPEGRLRRPPTAAQRAMAACTNEDVPASALVSLLETDPLLAQAVLSRANSAAYHRGGPPCLVLAEAITRQGRRNVHNVLLQQTLSGLVCSPGGGWNEMVGKIWSHMVRTGPIARAVAPLFDVDSEQAFALALLHDVGKLAMFDRIATLRTAHRGDLDLPRPAIAHALRLLHESLGGLCALGWGFGDDAALSIARHHRDPVPAERDPASEVIWLAEHVDLAAQRGVPISLPVLWHAAGLTADLDAVQAVLDEIAEVPAAAW